MTITRYKLGFAVEIALLLALTLMAIRCLGGEARLNIEQRGPDVVLFVTGGTSNVQYQVWTPAFNNPADGPSWYYWRRIYSADFHPYSEVLIYGSNTSQQPRRFFQIRGTLPD